MTRPARLTTIAQAAAFVRRSGLALVYPKADVVLPSLWEAVAGPAPLEWAIRDEDGKFVAFTPEMDRVWRWKDELPAKHLACVGKHLGRSASLVSPELLPCLYAMTGRRGRPDDFREAEGLTTLELDVAEAVLAEGPCSGPRVRRLLGTNDKKGVDRAIERLERLFVLTNARLAERTGRSWPAIEVDVLARWWKDALRHLPARDEARLTLAERVLTGAKELSALDLAAVLGWSAKDAAATLDDLVDRRLATRRDEDGYALWSIASRRRAKG